VNGLQKGGFISKILVAGFSGIVVITWAEEQKTMLGKLNAGGLLGVMRQQCVKIVSVMIMIAAQSSDKRCCTGPMIRVPCKVVTSGLS
jgi:hypothetical protein